MSAMVLRLKQAGINTQVLQVHSPLLLAFHPIHPWFPLSCLLSTPSAPGSPSLACFPPHPPLVPPLLPAFHPIHPWFPLSCLRSTPSAPGSPSPACFPPHPPLVPSLLLAFHPIRPWFPLSCLLSTPSAPGSLSPACFPPHPPLVPPLLLDFHPIRPWFPLSCLLSTPSTPGSPLSCLLSTPSAPGSPSPACFPPHPPLLPPLLLAFHPIRPCFPLSCLLSTPSTPGSPSPACFPPHPPLVPPLLLAFHPIRPWFPLSCLLSTPSAPGSPSPACFPPHPPLVPSLLLAFHPIRPCFPLSCLLSTPSAPGSPSPACFPPHPPLVPSLLLAFHPIHPWLPLSCLLSTPSAPGSPSPGCFPPHPPLVHTALAIPPHDKMEWTSRGQFVKASPAQQNFSSIAINPAGKGSLWYGRRLVLSHYNKGGELRRGAYVEYYTEDKRQCPLTGCKRLLPTEGVDNYAVIDVDCILSLVHIVPSCEDDESGGPMPAPYVVTAPSASPQTTRYRAGQWQQQWQRRRCSLLPRPASRNNFSEQGEGERAREVATTAKRSGGERARRWLMDELGALGVDSGEEKWVRWRVGVGEVRSPSLRQLRLRAVGRQAAGAVERQGELRAGRAPHPSPSSARLALPPLLLLSTNSSAERPQRDDLGAAWARAVNMGGSMSGSFIDTNMSGGGGIAGPGRQGHPGMEGVRRPQAGTGSIGSTRSTGSIGRRSASMDVSRRCWQSMPFSLTDASSSLGFPQHRQHGSAAVPTMVAAVAWWAAVWSAVTASAW
ncbi:unnamed protein product [Closterium sp. NIES-64]|nr:unnamed protein product [Closterium sp. NIES-64]